MFSLSTEILKDGSSAVEILFLFSVPSSFTETDDSYPKFGAGVEADDATKTGGCENIYYLHN